MRQCLGQQEEAGCGAAVQVCHSPEDEETLLICDWCQEGTHMACHTPVVEDLPDDEEQLWFCCACADTVRQRDAAVEILQEHHAACEAAGLTPDAVAAAEVSPEEELEVLADLLGGGSPGGGSPGESAEAERARGAAPKVVGDADEDEEDDVIVMDTSGGHGDACGAAGAAAECKEEAVADANPGDAGGAVGDSDDAMMQVRCA